MIFDCKLKQQHNHLLQCKRTSLNSIPCKTNQFRGQCNVTNEQYRRSKKLWRKQGCKGDKRIARRLVRLDSLFQKSLVDLVIPADDVAKMLF